MGITASKQTNPFELLKDQLRALGDKYPFGDDEILRIARCLTYLRHPKVASSGHVINHSFLTNWAVFCSTLPKANFAQGQQYSLFVNLLHVDQGLLVQSQNSNDMIEDLNSSSNSDSINVDQRRLKIRKLMIELEEKFLPPSFSEKLEETVFALLAPSEERYNNDEFLSMEALTMQRLEKFLNGLANSSRRGSRKALEVIYNCCLALTNKKDKNYTKASAKELIDLAYRLALASLVIDMVMNMKIENNDEEEDEKENTGENIDESGKGDDDESGGKEENDDIENDTKQNLNTEIDLAPYYPQDVNQSLVESLEDFASKYSSMGTSSYSSFNTTASNFSQLSTSSYSHVNPDNTNSNGQEKEDKDGISLEAFMTWAESNAPCISASIETFVHRIFFLDKPYPPSRMEFMFPLLRGQHSAFINTKSSPLLFTFACMSPSLGGAWFRLYTSDEDGLSFNRLQNALLGYSGPTLLIIKEVEGGGIFGAFTSTAWKENKDFYGNSDCFLFQLQPNVKVIRPRGRGGTNFMYCNSESRSRGYDGQAHGIGFGGTTEKPRLFIAESFDGCMANASDLTFEGGALLPPLTNTGDTFNPSSRKYFDIESLEVWGVGGDELVATALGARRQQREIKAANIRKARKVDKAAFLDDLKSGMIESKAFKHREEMRGREDCQLEDSDKKKYNYEK